MMSLLKGFEELISLKTESSSIKRKGKSNLRLLKRKDRKSSCSLKTARSAGKLPINCAKS